MSQLTFFFNFFRILYIHVVYSTTYLQPALLILLIVHVWTGAWFDHRLVGRGATRAQFLNPSHDWVEKINCFRGQSTTRTERKLGSARRSIGQHRLYFTGIGEWIPRPGASTSHSSALSRKSLHAYLGGFYEW